LNINRIKYSIQNNQIGEFVWNLFGTMVPILFNFIRNPIFTRHFTPEEYGYFSIVFLTFNYFVLVLYSWLVSIIWRFYYEYKSKNKLPELFSSLGLIYIIGSAILLIITIIWLNITDLTLVRRIIFFSLLYYLINDLTSYYLVTIRLERRFREYNILQSLRALINFTFLCFFSFVLKFRIEAIALSYFISTLLFVIYVIISASKKYKFISFSVKFINKYTLKNIIRYGSAGLIINVSVLILYNSDRYFVALYYDIGKVGIYNQNYIIAQTAISAITLAFYNTINPEFNRRLSEDIRSASKYISTQMFNYVLLLAPITLFISLFAYQFNFLLLGQKFREGYQVITYVALSLFIYGLSTFSETKFKFTNHLLVIVIGFIIACFINIILNFFLLRIFDYTWAAKTTLGAFIFLFIFFIIYDKESYIELVRKYYVKLIILILAIILIIILSFWARSHFGQYRGLIFSIIELTVYAGIIYSVILLLLLKKNK